MSSCDPFADDLVLLAAGELQEERRAALEAHLDECSACVAALDDVRAADRALRARPVEAVPADVRRRIERRLRRPVFANPRWLVPAGIAACLALVWLLALRRPSERERPAPVPPVSENALASAEILSDDALADLSDRIAGLSKRRASRAIPSSALVWVDARLEGDALSSDSAGADRRLHAIGRRIRTLSKETWYLPGSSRRTGPSSWTPVARKKTWTT